MNPNSSGYAKLKRALDRAFSEYVRRKACDPQGYVACVTCGRKGYWRSMQCGHFVKRVHLATRWDERNVGVQCWRCNETLDGNLEAFEAVIVKAYGQAVVDDLKARRHWRVKLDRAAVNMMIAEFREKFRALPKLRDPEPFEPAEAPL